MELYVVFVFFDVHNAFHLTIAAIDGAIGNIGHKPANRGGIVFTDLFSMLDSKEHG